MQKRKFAVADVCIQKARNKIGTMEKDIREGMKLGRTCEGTVFEVVATLLTDYNNVGDVSVACLAPRGRH